MHPPHASTTTSTTKHRRSQTRICQWLKITQEQVGHSYASTTAIYTSVSDDFKTKTLQAALRRVYGDHDGNREQK